MQCNSAQVPELCAICTITALFGCISFVCAANGALILYSSLNTRHSIEYMASLELCLGCVGPVVYSLWWANDSFKHNKDTITLTPLLHIFYNYTKAKNNKIKMNVAVINSPPCLMVYIIMAPDVDFLLEQRSDGPHYQQKTSNGDLGHHWRGAILSCMYVVVFCSSGESVILYLQQRFCTQYGISVGQALHTSFPVWYGGSPA